MISTSKVVSGLVVSEGKPIAIWRSFSDDSYLVGFLSSFRTGASDELRLSKNKNDATCKNSSGKPYTMKRIAE
jgi:hypothetical protein